MNKFSIHIKDIQQIKELKFSIDLNTSGLDVIIGKNGVGKTILFKAIQNLVTSNTFKKTSNSYIYQQLSSIEYKIIKDTSTVDYLFVYNEEVKTLDFKGEVDGHTLHNIYVELPIPFGKRFSQFQRLGEIDRELRPNIISQKYTKPTELINLLNYIYDTDRFNDLKEITIKQEKYYVRVLENDYYIREDYLSSAEYFIISIYKIIQKKCKLIAIDEIDISLDAMAQVRFIDKLRELSVKNNTKILFSTHSLALIKTLDKKKGDTLYYMELKEGVASFEEKSYNYIKSLLYGFQDYDRYILTEDEVLKDYIEHVLRDEDILSKYIIIYIGGASNTVDLMRRNETMKIFEDKKNVCTILDGDKKIKTAYKDKIDIFFSPFLDIEDNCLSCFTNLDFGEYSPQDLKDKYNVQNVPGDKNYAKSIYGNVLLKLKTQRELFEHISKKENESVKLFRADLIEFLREGNK